MVPTNAINMRYIVSITLLLSKIACKLNNKFLLNMKYIDFYLPFCHISQCNFNNKFY